MKPAFRGVLLTVACAGVLGYLVFRLWPETGSKPAPDLVPRVVSIPPPEQPQPIVSPTKPAAVAAKSIKPDQAAPKADTNTHHRAGLTVKAGAPIPELFPHQAERDQLITLASTYDAKNIPLIAPSLKHADPTVREAARQALVQMGDAAAIPYLEDARKNTRDPEEAESIRQIIEFLSLPRFMDVVTMGANSPAPTR